MVPTNEKARGSGNEGLERLGIMGNVGIGSLFMIVWEEWEANVSIYLKLVMQ